MKGEWRDSNDDLLSYFNWSTGHPGKNSYAALTTSKSYSTYAPQLGQWQSINNKICVVCEIILESKM